MANSERPQGSQKELTIADVLSNIIPAEFLPILPTYLFSMDEYAFWRAQCRIDTAFPELANPNFRQELQQDPEVERLLNEVFANRD